MKTTGVSCETKFGLLGFLGHPTADASLVLGKFPGCNLGEEIYNKISSLKFCKIRTEQQHFLPTWKVEFSLIFFKWQWTDNLESSHTF